MKKSILLSTVIGTLVLSCTTAFASSDVNVRINSTQVEFSEEMGAPFIDENYRTQVPFRATMEAFGAEVEWDKETRTAIATKDGVEVKVPIGTDTVVKDGVEQKIDTKSLIKDNRTYLPIRAVVEAFGANVNWDKDAKTVVIDKTNVDAKDIILKATEKSQKWKNYDMIVSTVMKSQMVIEGQPIELSIDMGGVMTTFNDDDNVKMKSDLNSKMTMLGQTTEQPTKQYITMDKDGMILYQTVNNQWTKMEVKDEALMKQLLQSASDNLDMTCKMLKDAKYLGEYTIDDKNVMKIEATISLDEASDMLGGTLDSVLEASGEDKDAVLNMLKELGDFKYIMWIDKDTNEMLEFTMNLNSIYKSMAKSMVSSGVMTAEEAKPFENMEAIVSYKIDNINKAEDFEIPKEALEAKDFEEVMKELQNSQPTTENR